MAKFYSFIAIVLILFAATALLVNAEEIDAVELQKLAAQLAQDLKISKPVIKEIANLETEIQAIDKVINSHELDLQEIESVLEESQEDIENLEQEASEEVLKQSPEVLESFASEKIDVAVSFSENGVVYEKDIFEHGEELYQGSSIDEAALEVAGI